MRFGVDFCENLVSEQIQSSYYLTSHVKQFLDNTVELFNCELGEKEQLVFEMPPDLPKEVEKCFLKRQNLFYYHCANFCEHFDLVKASDLFDGNLLQFKRFIDYFLERKERALADPSANLLIQDLHYELSVLRTNWEAVFEDPFYYPTINKTQFLDT